MICFKDRHDIEGLRAVAVLAVLIHHGFPKALCGGFVGVDVFFVISGYLIGWHLLEDIQDGRLSFLRFYAKRARRLFPALALVLISMCAVGWRYFSVPEFAALGRHIIAAVLFSNNILLWSESGYFDTVALEKPLLHLWSLGIEEQFYLLVPGMLWLSSKGTQASSRWVARAAAVSLIATILGAHFEYSAAFYLLHTRFWELAVGVVLAQVELRLQSSEVKLLGPASVSRRDQREITAFSCVVFFSAVVVLGTSGAHWQMDTVLEDFGLVLVLAGAAGAVLLAERSVRQQPGTRLTRLWADRNRNNVNLAISVAGLVLIAISALTLTSTDWPGAQTMLPVLGSAFVIAAGPTALPNRLLSAKPCVFVGGISYPLYLWHWPAIVAFRIMRPDATAAELFIPLGMAFALAWMTKALVEDPLRFGRFGATSFPRPRLRFVVSGMAAAGILGAMIVVDDGSSSRFPAGLQAIAAWSEDNVDAWRIGRCYFHSTAITMDFDGECTPRKRVGNPLLLLWGDSHAADLYSGMMMIQSSVTVDIAQWTVAGCPPTIKQYPEGAICSVWSKRAMDRLAKYKPDTIVLAGAWERYMETGLAPKQIMDMLFDTVRHLKQLGVRHIVVFGPGPLWTASLPVDLFRYMVRTRSPNVPERLGTVSDAIWTLDSDMAAESAAEAVQYVSVIKYFCNHSGCLTEGNKTLSRPDLLYRDRDHLSVSGSRLLIAHAESQIFGGS